MTINYTTLLGLAQPVTGTEANTWGTVVNDSVTALVEDAIAGSATEGVTAGDWTLTTTGSGAENQARSAILIPTGIPGVSRNIIAPSSSKAYIVDNQSNGAVVLKGVATTGATIATGTTALVAWNGTDFVLVSQALANVTGVLPVAKGGTGITSFGTGVATALGQNVTGSGGMALSTSPTLTTPNLGTPSVATLTNATGLPIVAGTTGTLAVNRGGTGVTTSTGTGSSVLSTSPTLVTPLLGTPTSGNATNLVGLPLTTGVTGTLPVANGGTGASNATDARTNLGLGTIATQNANAAAITGGTITGITDLAVADGGTGASTASGALTSLGAYAASNPNGYTTNVGTVTSVSGSGGYGGLTLSGTVTTSGSLTMGGTPTGSWPISVTGSSASTTGNSASATVLQTTRTIGGVSFNGSANINLPGVNTAGNQNTSGNAATATNATNATNLTGTLPVANGGTGVTTSTGTGGVVLSTSPTLTTPNLGTPSVATLTNATGLPIVAGTTGTLSIVRGGTGATTVATARTNLGLGTIATQNANSVALTGGSVNGTTVGASTAGTGSFTTLSATGVTTLQAGTALLPALTTTGDTNTGVWFPAADTAAVSTGGTEQIRIPSTGGLLVGCTSLPNASVFGFGINVSDGTGDFSIVCSAGADTGGNRQIAFINGNGLVGSIVTGGSGTSYSTSSDYRLKNITGPVTGSGAFIDALKPCKGSWKADDSVFVGFLAHEFQEVSPVSVYGAKDETKVEQYEVTPAVIGVTAVEASEGVEAVTGIESAPAVMGERTVPIMQGMQASSSEVMANIVAEIQSLRLRLAPLEVVAQEQQALIESLTTRLTTIEGIV